MDKKLQHLINRSNLTARERYLLLIKNDVEAYKTGKEFLTAADKAALEGWHAEKSEDAREWNTLNEGWRYSGRMGLEGELHFHDAQAAYLQTRPVLMEFIKYPLHREMELMFRSMKDIQKTTPERAYEIAQMQRAVKLEEGLEYEYVVYRLAFERLSAEDRKRMNELYAEIEVDHTYLAQEEVIANLLRGKEDLTKSAKEKLAELIADCAYNAFAKEYQLLHYFACIPLAEVARHFLAWKGVAVSGKPLAQKQEADDEDSATHDQIQKAVEAYAKEHGVSVEDILKQGFIHWYDEEGFAYTPLIVSDDRELFLRWLTTKEAAKAELEKLIVGGVLATQKNVSQGSHRVRKYKEALETEDDTVVTGASLYAWQSDFEFVKDFKERVDEYEPNLGLVYAKDDPEHKGEHLDQEFLICQLDGKGEPLWLSHYGLALLRLETSMESVLFFKEEKRDGKLHLVFKNSGVEHMFRESLAQFKEGYGKLLALKVITDKLSAVYETDLAFRLTELFSRLDAHIEAHNEALETAQKDVGLKSMSTRAMLEIDPALYIDKATIKPDEKLVAEHTEKLKKIFWNF